MRALSSLLSIFLLAARLQAANEEFRAPIVPQLPAVGLRTSPEVAPTLPQLANIPQLSVPQASVETAAEATAQTPLAAELGIKPDAPLTPALSPVSDQLSSPAQGQDASVSKDAADADWQSRTGERPLNIVLAAAESVPLIKTGGLADVIDAIGRGFAARGHNVSLFLPKHAQINTGNLQFKKVPETVQVPVAGRIETGVLWEARHEGMRIFLVEHDGFFKRDAPYGGYYGDFPDSDERFIFFSRAILEASKVLDLKPDVVHAHDWHAALTAPMLKLLYGNDPVLAQTKSVVTLHNMAFQGNFEAATLAKAGFEQKHFTADALEHEGRFNFLHGGIRYADAVTTVSPTYAKEIQNDPKFGMGLETVLKARGADLHGIINGVDQQMWDPETDGILSRNYGPQDVGLGKAAAKKALQASAGLTMDPRAPMFVVASRLAHQKGLDLVAEVAPTLVKLGGQLIVTGGGDSELVKQFAELAARFPKSVFLHGFDEYFVRRVFAAADFLLMPSRFEPCGLSQLMAQRYGALPIVTKTGGLSDTVTDVRDNPMRGDGLFLRDFTPAALAEAVVAANEHFHDPRALEISRHSAMMKDSSWDLSVERYLALFYGLLIPVGTK